MFEAEVGGSVQPTCTVCGLTPASDVPVAGPAAPTAGKEVSRVTLSKPSVVRRHRPASKQLLAVKLAGSWLLLLAVVFLLAKWVRDTRGLVELQAPGGEVAGTVDDSDEKLLEEVLPKCQRTLVRYLSTESVDERRFLVLNIDSVRERMEKFYQTNSPITVNPQELSLIGSTVVHLPEGPSVLTQWETNDGFRFDAAFRDDGKGWELDWDHFVRFGDEDWALFVAGSGPDEVEFRLLARQRNTMDEAEAEAFGVVLYAPQRKRLAQAGFKAEVEPLDPDSRDAMLLQAAFRHQQEGTPLMGALKRDINPQGMIRVRVVVKRVKGAGRNRFFITKVRACHWYSSSAWGIRPSEIGLKSRLDSGDAK